MARYTIELGKLIESGYPLSFGNYPIFDEEYRSILEQKVIDHYYFNEIGAETADRFSFYLRRKMREIMPYYNQLYATTLLEFDPLVTEYYENGYKEILGISRNLYADLGSKRDNSGREASSEKELKSRTGNEDSVVNAVGKETTGQTTNDTELETIQSNQVTTNDLTAQTDTTNSGTGNTTTWGLKDNVFSDVPQGKIDFKMLVKADGETTITGNGYATTATYDKTRENSKTATEETSSSTTKNTGTVDVTGNSTRNNTKDGKLDKTIDDTKTTTGKNTQIYNENNTIDYEKTNDRNEKFRQNRKEKERENTERDKKEYTKGRKGFSPSKLLEEYRQQILNIDMQIIDDLEELFMLVY